MWARRPRSTPHLTDPALGHAARRRAENQRRRRSRAKQSGDSRCRRYDEKGTGYSDLVVRTCRSVQREMHVVAWRWWMCRSWSDTALQPRERSGDVSRLADQPHTPSDEENERHTAHTQRRPQPCRTDRPRSVQAWTEGATTALTGMGDVQPLLQHWLLLTARLVLRGWPSLVELRAVCVRVWEWPLCPSFTSTYSARLPAAAMQFNRSTPLATCQPLLSRPSLAPCPLATRGTSSTQLLCTAVIQAAMLGPRAPASQEAAIWR